MKNILVLTLCLLLDLIILKTNINSDIYIVALLIDVLFILCICFLGYFPTLVTYYLSVQEFKEDKYFYYVCIYTVLSVTEYLLSIL